MGFLFFLEFIVFAVLVYGLYKKSTNGICRSRKRLDGKTCLVTGGTSGIGLEISIDFALRGARVIVACPFEEEGTNAEKKIIEETGNSNVVFKLLDLGSFDSVRSFAADIIKTEERLDILMNNAAVASAENKLEDSVDIVLKVNYFGHFLLTLLLLPLLKKSGTPSAPSRIVNTSSVMHRLATLNVKKVTVMGKENVIGKKNLISMIFLYSNSKLCLLLFSRELKKKLLGSNVVINNVDPGEVFTKIFLIGGIHSFLWYFSYLLWWCIGKTPFEGAQTSLHVALDDKAGQSSGLFYRDCKVCRTLKAASDEELSTKLWDKSVDLVKFGDEELKYLLE